MKQGTSPESFGRYSLVRRIAVGGMGELYLAERAGFAGFSKRVVVKCIRPDLAGDDEFVEMFLDEGRLAAMITHPNVVQIYELGQVDGQYFMAMEYVPGKNLAEIVERLRGPMEIPYAVAVLNQLCSALTAAHESKDREGKPLQLVHRDVSPPNVLVSFSGAVKLTDFGIAKIAIREKQTRAGVVKGKFVYLSPEQALGKAVDARADVYALGLVLFEASVGRRANPGVVEVEQIYAASQGRVLDPAECLDGYPEELRQIFHHCTSVDPAHRFQSAREMQHALVDFAGRHGMMISSPQLAEYMQRLFPRDAVEAGEGDFLGDRTRESSAIDAVPSEELETLTDGPRNVVSQASLFPSEDGGNAFAYEGGRPSGEVTTEHEADQWTRELDMGLPISEFAALSAPVGDRDETLMVATSHGEDGVDDDTLAARPGAREVGGPPDEEQTREVQPIEALRPIPSDALDRADTLPRALELRAPESRGHAHAPARDAQLAVAPAARRGVVEPVAGEDTSGRDGEPWWRSRRNVLFALGLAALVVMALLVGSFLAGPSEALAPIDEAPPTGAEP